MPNTNQHKRQQDYVLVYPQIVDCPDVRVLLIERQKPDWQEGKLNLVGGKINDDEDLIAAAEREFTEETGLFAMKKTTTKLGLIQGSWGRVHVFSCFLDSGLASYNPLSSKEGAVAWYPMYIALRDERLVPNLQVVMPLCHMGVQDWTINDRPNLYEFEVRVS